MFSTLLVERQRLESRAMGHKRLWSKVLQPHPEQRDVGKVMSAF